MRLQTLLLPLLALTLPASSVHAGAIPSPGVNLRWGRCYADGGPQNFSFACNTNFILHRLYGSFVPASDILAVRGFEIVVDIATDSPVLPAWWQFRSLGSCRQNSLTIAAVPPEAPVNCPRWSGPRNVDGAIGSYQVGLRGPNTARVLAHVTVPVNMTVNLFGAQELFAFILAFDSQLTAGAGACAGCEVPACIVLSSVNLVTTPTGPSQRLTGPANQTDSDFVTWQGGGAPGVGGAIGCPAATPTLRSTWGSVKSLYR